jgi:hypothetical protein
MSPAFASGLADDPTVTVILVVWTVVPAVADIPIAGAAGVAGIIAVDGIHAVEYIK